jgi:hypothetical protein
LGHRAIEVASRAVIGYHLSLRVNGFQFPFKSGVDGLPVAFTC